MAIKIATPKHIATQGFFSFELVFVVDLSLS